MIEGQSTHDLMNKIKKYERIIKEQAAEIVILNAKLQDATTQLDKDANHIARLKSRIANMTLALRRKGGQVEDSSPDDDL